jgi:predicted amino acid-binding ACT domain protein
MNRALASVNKNQAEISAAILMITQLVLAGALLLILAVSASAQSAELQQKLAAVKQAAAENKQKLRQYQWTETTQLTLKGDAKPPAQKLCQYGPDGQVQKTPIGPPPEQPGGGRVKQRVVAKKKAEMTDYMDDVKGLLTMYVPPDPQNMQQAFQAGKVSFNPAGGVMNLIFTDYAQPGDRMTLTFDPASKKIIALSVDTFMGQAKDAVTLQVRMASLPDGTNYSQQTVLNASAKQLVVTTTNSNYQRL